MASFVTKTRLCHALNVLGFIGFTLQLTGMCIFQARVRGALVGRNSKLGGLQQSQAWRRGMPPIAPRFPSQAPRHGCRLHCLGRPRDFGAWTGSARAAGATQSMFFQVDTWSR